MTNRPPWPDEVREAYERGERVWWSPVRNAWMISGKPRTEVVAQTRRGDNGAEARQAVATALEEMAPRAVAVPKPRPVPASCPRCGGRIIASTDEHGASDDFCLACSYRVGTPLTRDEADALRQEHDAREIGAMGRRVRRARAAHGVSL